MSADHGRCLCGQVEFDVTLEQRAHILCHCNTCKKFGGGSFSLNQIVHKDNFKVTKGEDLLKMFTYTGDSGKPVHCYYCENCTAHVYHHQLVLGDKYIAKIALLDNANELPPGAEVYGKDRLPWLQEVAETFEQLPPS